MRKRVRLLVSLAVTIALAGSLIGCGGKSSSVSSSEEGSATISVQVEKTWLPYYEQVAKNVMEDNPGSKIEFKEIGSFDHLDVLDATDATNNDIADVFAFPADRLYTLAQNQVLSTIDAEKMAEDIGGFDNFKEGLGGNLQVDGEYLAFPYNIETLIGFVNVANAKASGIDINKNIEMTSLNYDQLLTVLHDCWFGVSFTNSAGFELLGKKDDGTFYSDAIKPWSELNAEQKKLFEGLFNYWKSHNDSKTNLWDKDASGAYIDEQFKTGGSNAIKIDGPWSTPAVKELVGDASNLEIIPLTKITFNGKPLIHWKGGWGLGVNARVEEDELKMDLAEDFIKELVAPENAKDLFLTTGKVLENANPEDYSGIDELDKKVIDATYAGYEEAIARPLYSEYGEVWGSWQNALLSWSAKKPANAEGAYAELKASFDDMMSRVQN